LMGQNSVTLLGWLIFGIKAVCGICLFIHMTRLKEVKDSIVHLHMNCGPFFGRNKQQNCLALGL
jgi:hypothetical protein